MVEESGFCCNNRSLSGWSSRKVNGLQECWEVEDRFQWSFQGQLLKVIAQVRETRALLPHCEGEPQRGEPQHGEPQCGEPTWQAARLCCSLPQPEDPCPCSPALCTPGQATSCRLVDPKSHLKSQLQGVLRCHLPNLCGPGGVWAP